MKKITLTLAGFLMMGAAVQAQSTADSVKTVINNLFTAMRQADTAALQQCFAPGAVIQTAGTDKDGNPGVQTTAISGFAAAIGKMPAGTADERITFDALHIDGPLASVWTPYRFYLKQQFHHCGVNSFLLVRLPEGWKIQHVMDTRRKDGCVEERGSQTK
ncbi:nuclear transport factor 2 family protein [Chitinophaga sp. Mgbs1]|uniref:Nuclear transport factor 2 family protein n=1 Tax=Chitinophaga solisilvae TaxID=1233460 RepID=A0A3S1AZ62_9BACT|nr:nuclear transport factor 2 family protein [Chitinophaga solisilvae]